MARRAKIDPEFFADEAICLLSSSAKLLYIGLVTQSDKRGFFKWKPTLLKASIFPGDKEPIEPLFEELLSIGAIRKVDSENGLYGEILFLHRWRKKRKAISGALRRYVFERDMYRCVYCGATEAECEVEFEADHVVPRSKGGPDCATNLVCACKPCNRQKGSMSVVEWMKSHV